MNLKKIIPIVLLLIPIIEIILFIEIWVGNRKALILSWL